MVAKPGDVNFVGPLPKTNPKSPGFVGPKQPPKEGDPDFVGPVRPGFVSGGGSGGSSDKGSGGSSYTPEADTQRQEAERQKAIENERARQREIAQAKEDAKQKIKEADIKERERLLTEQARRITEITKRYGGTSDIIKTREQKAKAKEMRDYAEEKGIDISTPARQRKFIKEYNPITETTQQTPPQQTPPQDRPVFNKTKSTASLFFDTGLLSVGGAVGNRLIKMGYDKIQEFNLKKEQARQELLDKYNSGEKLSYWEKEKIKRYLPKPDKQGGGFSLTQKYYEKFGAEFYSEGERQEIVQQSLKEFNEAKDYEQQQKSIQNLRNKGINVILKTDPISNKQSYEIQGDITQQLAPTSKWQNILIGTSDIFMKGAVFSPFMSSGMASKQEAVVKTKLTEREKLELYKKAFGKVKTNPEEAKEFLRKAYQTKDKNIIKGAEKFIKDAFRDSKAQKDYAKNLIRDVQQQELLTESIVGLPLIKTKITPPKPTTSDLVSQESLFIRNKPVQLERISEVQTSVYAGKMSHERYSPTENLFIKSKTKIDTTKLGEENIFEGTQPSGKIAGGLGESGFQDLGTMSNRLDSQSLDAQTKTDTLTKSQLNIFSKTKTDAKTDVLSKSGLLTKTRTDTLSKTGQQELTKQAEEQLTKQQSQQLLGLKEASKTLEKYKQDYLFRFRQGSRPTRPKQRIPKQIITGFPFGFGLPSKTATTTGTKKSGGDLFKVFGRRFGSDWLLKVTKTQKQAEQSLKGFLTGTLGRSGYIQKSGKKLGFEELSFGGMFRPAKRDRKRVVQKARYSLSSPFEKSEIQYFKKKSKKQNILNWI